MKNTSKLTFFAAVVLRALLLITPVSALAAAGDGQEIGVPQAMEAPVKGCFGAVLSPDADNFYTVREGFLTQYQINPFKKIGAIAIDWEQFKERRGDGGCRVLMTNDKSKLIFVYSKTMFLLDAKTGQALNKFERKNGRMVAATLNDNELVILDGIHTDESYFFNLTIWDADTLKLKREIHDLGKSFGFFRDQAFSALSKIRNRIYMATGQSFVVLNSKTYAPELSVSYRPLGRYDPKISKNFQKLYVREALKLTDHLNNKQTTFENVKDGSVLVFDQETREVRIENVNSVARDELDPFLVNSSQLSRNRGYVMVSYDFSRALLVNLNTAWFHINQRTGVWFDFHQYESGEAILLDNNKYFQLTPGARKYLVMKNSAGKIVPINDAAFTKYNRAENRP